MVHEKQDLVVKKINKRLDYFDVQTETDQLNKLIYFNEMHTKFDDAEFKSVVVINNFLIDQMNLDKLELLIHQLKTETEGK
jgi:hypothetical protein